MKPNDLPVDVGIAPPAQIALLALEQMGGAILTCDLRGRISWCNRALRQLIGCTAEEALGRLPEALMRFSPEDGPQLERLHEHLGRGQAFRGRFRVLGAHGRDVWLDIDVRPLLDPAGRTVGFVALHIDVTEPVRDHDHLHKVVNSSVAGLMVQDSRGFIIACNPEAERLFERSEADLVGRLASDPRWRLLREDGMPLSADEHPSMQAASDPRGEPVRDRIIGLTLSGGRRRWLQASCHRIPARVAGDFAVVSSFIDLSAQREALAAVAAERMRLRVALDGTQAGVWEFNLQTGQTEANERWANIGGYTLAELAPLTLGTWAERIHPDDRPHIDAALREHARGHQANFDVQCRSRHRDGRWIWLSARGRIATRTPDGRPEWMYGTLLDITEAREAQLALQSAHAQLEGLFSKSPVAMALGDLADGRILEFNDALLQLLGHDSEGLGSLRHRDMLPPESRLQARANHRLLLEQGRFGPQETEVLHRDGHRVPVLLSGILVTLPDGRERIWSILQDMQPRLHLEQRLRTEARTDRLTGLPNRTLLVEKLERCVAAAAADPTLRFALLFLDFDRFKLVNDTLGHEAGDQLLQVVADRLRRVLRLGDVRGDGPRSANNVVARLGGDEFVVLLAEHGDAHAATVVAQRILKALSTPCMIEQREIHTSASIGIVLGDAGSGSATTVLRNADMAMYEAKRAGRATYAFFDEQMLVRVSRAVRLEEALRHAIELGQFHLVYQPIIDLRSGAMSSVEALLRFQHPELGAVSPAEFIPVAEDSGLILPIGEWVLRQSCHQWRAWQDEAPERAPRSISVNLSRVQMALGERLLELVARVLAECRMPASRLQLEVTEREVMRDPVAALALMRGLREMGVRLAMDDFGTGSSSLGCLRDYPFDVIKIDKSFIDGLPGNAATLAVIHGTVAVIQNLGMASVAEGIEDAVQVGMLQSLGCRYGQGYHFARPLAADRLLGVALPAVPAWSD